MLTLLGERSRPGSDRWRNVSTNETLVQHRLIVHPLVSLALQRTQSIKRWRENNNNNIESTDLIKYAESYVNFHSQMMNVFLQRFKSFVYFSSFLFNELVSTWCLQLSRTGRNQQHAAGASSSSDAARSQMTIATCFRKFAERSLLSLWSDLCSSPRLKLNNKPIQSQSLLLQSTPVERPLFQDKLAKPVPEMYNQFGFKQGKRRRGFWDAVASAGP